MKNDSIAEKNNWPPYLKAIYENPDRNSMENSPFEAEAEANPLDSFLNKSGSDNTESREKNLPGGQDTPFMSSFLPELIHSIKNTLISIKNVSQLSAEKFNDADLRKYSQRSITEDIKKIDSVLNSLL